ncbi:MAG: hypothetical protein AAFQ94_21595 [Bacteroidota bacterium]
MEMTNYQIIANEKQLKEFIAWLPALEPDEKYYLCLFARKKYSKELINSNDKAQLKRFTATRENIFNKIRQLEVPMGTWQMKDGPAPLESLALYIMINPRSLRKATEMMGKRCWEMMSTQNYNVHSESLTCIQKSKARTCFVDFDIDTKEIDLDRQWLDTEIGKNNYQILETRGGYHILVRPNEATTYRQKEFNDKNWYQKIQKKYPVDQSGDQLIPVAGTWQGGFIPTLLDDER